MIKSLFIVILLVLMDSTFDLMNNNIKKQIGIVLVTTIALVYLLSCRNDKDKDEFLSPHVDLKAISSFKFLASNNQDLTADIVGVIDETAKTVNVTVPHGTKVTNLLPDIEISEGATISPTGEQDFTNMLRYTVTAENKSIAKYDIIVTHAPSAENKIMSFKFLKSSNANLAENVTAGINHTEKIVIAAVPVGTSITNLTPFITLSTGASITPTTAQDFTNPVNYTVIAQNGAQTTYQVSVHATVPNLQRDALIEIYSSNPANTLDWDITDMDISNWKGVTTDANGKVTMLVMPNSGINVLPPTIQWLTKLTELDISFNNLTSVPTELKSLVNLKKLKLRSNKLTSLPVEIGLVTSLTSLNIESNLITQVPQEFGNLINLTELQLHHNRITYVSPEIKKLKNLKYLVLSGNQIPSIPAEIGQLSSLITLNLTGNLLTTIPKEVALISTLKGIHIEMNKLTSVPAEIAQITSLNYIYMTINSTLNSIPQAICNMNSLHGTVVLKDTHVVCN